MDIIDLLISLAAVFIAGYCAVLAYFQVVDQINKNRRK